MHHIVYIIQFLQAEIAMRRFNRCCFVNASMSRNSVRQKRQKKYEHRGKEQENGIAAHFHLCKYVVPVGSAAWGVPQPRAGCQSNQQSLMMDIIVYNMIARVSRGCLLVWAELQCSHKCWT